MQNLSTNIKKWILEISDGREIAVSQQNYDKVIFAKNDGKYTDFIKIDEDGEVKYLGEIGKIKEIREIKRQNTSGKYFKCDYGIAHNIHEECDCWEKYKISPWEFKRRREGVSKI